MNKRVLRTIRVEDTSDTDVDTVLTVEAICQSFRDALTLIIAGTGPNRVHVSPATNLSGASGMTR